MGKTILKLNASARIAGSHSRRLVEDLVDSLSGPDTQVIDRDLGASPPPFVDEAWVAANVAAPEQRTAEHRAALATSDALVAELQAADILVIGAPIYNFGVPAALKAWVDQVARARVTFRYSATGPVGLLTGKKAFVVVTSGGTPVDSAIDFATGYVRHVLGFLGITDVEIIAADRLMSQADAAVARARLRIRDLSAVDLASAG